MDMIGLVEKALNIRSYYHKVISGNIANVETPGYREKDIDFNRELEKQLGSVNGRPADSSIEVFNTPTPDGLASLDGNTVNMEDQMMRLTENQLMFHSLVQVTAKRFSMMKYLIREGR